MLETFQGYKPINPGESFSHDRAIEVDLTNLGVVSRRVRSDVRPLIAYPTGSSSDQFGHCDLFNYLNEGDRSSSLTQLFLARLEVGMGPEEYTNFE